MECINKSIIGASHINDNKPLQDSSLATVFRNCCVAVVSDGHGNKKHFRSEIGSKFASEAAMKKLAYFGEYYRSINNFENSDIMEKEIERLKVSIICEWHNLIYNHLQKEPFTEEELKLVSNSFKNRSSFDKSSPYGATLLACLLCEDYYLTLMIGDGAIIKITKDRVCTLINYENKKVFDDQPHGVTDSLCNPDSYNCLHHSIDRIREPICLALCSDGVSEAFENDSFLFKYLNSFIDCFVKYGKEETEEAIADSLASLSEKSIIKDDVSVAMVFSNINVYRRDKSLNE